MSLWRSGQAVSPGEIQSLPSSFLLPFNADEWQLQPTLALHTAASKNSTAEKIAVRCQCRGACSDLRCRHKKAQVKCTVHYHGGREYSNFVEKRLATEFAMIDKEPQ